MCVCECVCVCVRVCVCLCVLLFDGSEMKFGFRVGLDCRLPLDIPSEN